MGATILFGTSSGGVATAGDGFLNRSRMPMIYYQRSKKERQARTLVAEIERGYFLSVFSVDRLPMAFNKLIQYSIYKRAL